MRGVSLWLAVCKPSLAYCWAVLWGSTSAASWTRLCFSGGYSCVTTRLFEVTTWCSPLLVFTQTFWAVLDMNSGSVAEWRHWASLQQESDGGGERSLSSTRVHWQQAASLCCLLFAGMLRKRCLVFAWLLRKRYPGLAAHTQCFSHSFSPLPLSAQRILHCVTPGGSWPSSLKLLRKPVLLAWLPPTRGASSCFAHVPEACGSASCHGFVKRAWYVQMPLPTFI